MRLDPGEIASSRVRGGSQPIFPVFSGQSWLMASGNHCSAARGEAASCPRDIGCWKDKWKSSFVFQQKMKVVFNIRASPSRMRGIEACAFLRNQLLIE